MVSPSSSNNLTPLSLSFSSSIHTRQPTRKNPTPGTSTLAHPYFHQSKEKVPVLRRKKTFATAANAMTSPGSSAATRPLIIQHSRSRQRLRAVARAQAPSPELPPRSLDASTSLEYSVASITVNNSSNMDTTPNGDSNDANQNPNTSAILDPSFIRQAIAPMLDTVSYCSDHEESEFVSYNQFANGVQAAPVYDVEEVPTADTSAVYPTSSPSSSPTPNRAGAAAQLFSTAPGLDDIVALSDDQVRGRFSFDTEVGNGNWGQVYMTSLKPYDESDLEPTDPVFRLGTTSAGGIGKFGVGVVAVKVVHKDRDAVTMQRIRSLWLEMKITRSLRHEPHPSIIRFEAFVVSRSWAFLVMPYHSHIIPVQMDHERARPYFRQLCSAVGYLHERGITHNDIKPANILISHHDIPVIVDFGFAQQHKPSSRGAFLSTISWGTPEYLDPQRARGQPHDERQSDIWALGVTMFEVLVGRTPFEEDEEESFETKEELLVYWERTRAGTWMGDWSIPKDLEHLLRYMICPDPSYRISAQQAYYHQSLTPVAESTVSTPSFVRLAAGASKETPPSTRLVAVKKDKERKLKKVKSDVGARRKTKPATAQDSPALGESVRQQASESQLRSAKAVTDLAGLAGIQPVPEVPDKYLKKRDSSVLGPRQREGTPDRGSPTKIIRSAKPPRVTDAEDSSLALSPVKDRRPSSLVRPSSVTALKHNKPLEIRRSEPLLARTSTLRETLRDESPTSVTKAEALAQTMRSLEGLTAVKPREEKTRRPPTPTGMAHNKMPRTVSLDRGLNKEAKVEYRRSEAVVKLDDVTEIDERNVTFRSPRCEDDTEEHLLTRSAANQRAARTIATFTAANEVQTPTRPTHTSKAPMLEIAIDTEPAFTSSSGVTQSKRVVSADMSLELQRKINRDGMPSPGPGQEGKNTTPRKAKQSTAPSTVGVMRSGDTEHLENLDRLASWVKNMDRFVEEARKAYTEGRPAPVPQFTLPEELETLAQRLRSASPTPTRPTTPRPSHANRQYSTVPIRDSARRSVSPSKGTYGRSASPNKGTYGRATDKGTYGRIADKGTYGRGTESSRLKQRPAVSQVFRIFQSDKDKPLINKRSSHALRTAPSTPALRSAAARRVPTRKSESNLRLFSTVAASTTPKVEVEEAEESMVHHDEAELFDASQRLKSVPGIKKYGQGWTSASGPAPNLLAPPRTMGKPSSMVSLRKKARAFLPERDHVHYNDHIPEGRVAASTLPRPARPPTRSSVARPNTPAAESVFSSAAKSDTGSTSRAKNIFKLFSRKK
ncbi:Serine/threonine-protein kinase BRSK1 [Vanrija pseudolonga]|uniref:Serine/threonine-protein kinase BRSK1 n=1 Tax=Vanrija pseudolonga TaxID=143232 RepID=A0AAF0YEG7_9TREE|nr:Serine/threonine-protein kinase BRSK1 [Vanrija pseudolonga]